MSLDKAYITPTRFNDLYIPCGQHDPTFVYSPSKLVLKQWPAFFYRVSYSLDVYCSYVANPRRRKNPANFMSRATNAPQLYSGVFG